MKTTILGAAAIAAAIGWGCSSVTGIHVMKGASDAPAKLGEPLPASVALTHHLPNRPEDNPVIQGMPADVTTDFVEALRGAGLFRDVHFPILSTHRFEMTMEIEQKGWERPAPSSFLIKLPSIVTLGLFTQVVTCTENMHLEATVRLKVHSNVVATYTAESDVEVAYHWGWDPPDFKEGGRVCLHATHARLVQKMVDDREHLRAVLAAASKPPQG